MATMHTEVIIRPRVMLDRKIREPYPTKHKICVKIQTLGTTHSFSFRRYSYKIIIESITARAVNKATGLQKSTPMIVALITTLSLLNLALC